LRVSEKEPGPQGLQTRSELRVAMATTRSPALQFGVTGTQAVWPASAWKSTPGVHSLQPVAPRALEVEPGPQGVHRLPVCEIVLCCT